MASIKSDIKTFPFQGGVNTAVEKVLLPYGGFSEMNNMRNVYPGLEQRKGHKLHHTTASGSGVITLYQFSKGDRDEKRLYRQNVDGSVEQATDNPPTVTTGQFGSGVITTVANPIPASWSTLRDKVVFSDGARQHQLNGGSQGKIGRFIIYKGATPIPAIPEIGEDYTEQVIDDDSSTVATISEFKTIDDFDAIFIMADIRVNGINWTPLSANAVISEMKGHYWNGSWTEMTGFNDGTIKTSPQGNITLGASGATTWTLPSDEISKYQFGKSGYWYRFSPVSGGIGATISKVTYESSWQFLTNIWDGLILDAIEAYFFDATDGSYKLYGSTNITVNDMTPSDYVYFNYPDPIEGIYVDIGTTPNTNTATINDIQYNNGSSWSSLSNLEEATKGLLKSGFVTFSRNTADKKIQLAQSQYQSHWYRLAVSATLSATVSIGIKVIPYFKIADFGNKGILNVTWKERPVYVFNLFSSYLYIGKKGSINTLNGTDYITLETGDGRNNKIVAAKPFGDSLMVWQEEKGVEGGTISLFQNSANVANITKKVLSTTIGTFNAKSAIVVSGIKTQTNFFASDVTEFTTVAFSLSHHGIMATNGSVVISISNDIKNYFDSKNAEVIRRGYEDKHWLAFDMAKNVLRIGLVSGSSATNANVFPVYDLTSKTWSFDTPAQALSCFIGIEAESGNDHMNFIGSGTTDGFVYRVNTTNNDIDTAIDASITMELDVQGKHFRLKDEVLRIKIQSAGDITQTIAKNGSIIYNGIQTFSMLAENAGEETRRYRRGINEQGHHLSIKLRNNVLNQSMYLLDVGFSIELIHKEN